MYDVVLSLMSLVKPDNSDSTSEVYRFSRRLKGFTSAAAARAELGPVISILRQVRPQFREPFFFSVLGEVGVRRGGRPVKFSHLLHYTPHFLRFLEATRRRTASIPAWKL